MRRRELLAAGYLRDFRFSNPDDLQTYLYELDHRKVCYRVLETCPCADGSVLCRILQQYNNVDLIQI